MHEIPERKSVISPGPDLYLQVRLGFIAQGTSFTSWCEKRHINRANATMALRGGWTGPKARRLVARIVKAAGQQGAA